MGAKEFEAMSGLPVFRKPFNVTEEFGKYDHFLHFHLLTNDTNMLQYGRWYRLWSVDS